MYTPTKVYVHIWCIILKIQNFSNLQPYKNKSLIYTTTILELFYCTTALISVYTHPEVPKISWHTRVPTEIDLVCKENEQYI